MKIESKFLTSLLSISAMMPAVAAEKPNVVIIMPDDLSYSDFSFYNKSEKSPHTPNIDRLGQESIRLADFHVAPTSSPSRSQLMTGRNDDEVGAWHTVMGRYFLRPNEITMADIFKANGFSTALFGKWHLGDNYPFHPKDRGFEHTVMHMGGGIDQQPTFWGSRNNVPCVLSVDGKNVELNDANGSLPTEAIIPGKSNAFATNFFASKSIEYMKSCKEQDKPFFAYVAFNAAHGPQDMPPDARKGCSARTATIENLDKNVGRIMDFLDSSGLAKNTIVIYILGDNGMNNFMYRDGKGSAYEGGHHVPCFVRWPEGGYAGTPESARDIQTMVTEMDVLPTLMDVLNLKDVANREADLKIEGQSLKSLLDPKTMNETPAFASRILIVDNQRMDDLVKYKEACVMQDELDANGKIIHKWRLNRFAASQAWELFDLLTDEKQASNLLTESAPAPLKALAATLEKAYENWWTKMYTNGKGNEYARTIAGTKNDPLICLYSHDWHMPEGIGPWNQTQVANGDKSNGFNVLEIGQKGKYIFDLRRWPLEIASETTVTSTLKTSIRSERNNEPIFGKALPVHSARIKIWHGDKVYADLSKKVKSTSDGAIFKVKLAAGPVMVQTWFYDADGNELCGAYYNYVSLKGVK